MRNKKVAAGVEVVLMLGMIFSFCYFLDLNSNMFGVVLAAEGDEEDGEEDDMTFREWMKNLRGGELTEEESFFSYPISSSADGIGCCFISSDGQKCATASPDNCVDDSPFAEGALCAETQFCEKGCCFDEGKGIYDKNVLEIDCLVDWNDDSNCNMAAADLGCCVLGANSLYETEGQCRIDTLELALGDDAIFDWRGDVDELGCLVLGATQKEGACVLDEGDCKFVTEADCMGYEGNFSEGYLCTSGSFGGDCNMTRQTTCVDGKDGVYFMDSCGNIGNIYDSERIDDADYWDQIIVPEDVCGAEDFDGGNVESASCGNCNRFAGSICGSAEEDDFDVDEGSFYCRDTSCVYQGERYKNGEAWCVYDGAIGNGDDVVGSRHWKYVCAQGTVTVEPCADYRNQICIQSEAVNEEGVPVFKEASCIANNWRECIDLNSKDYSEDAAKKACISGGSQECYNYTLYPSEAARVGCVDQVSAGCTGSGASDMNAICEDSLNCRVDNIEIADKFSFDVCLPKYPAGFSLDNERYQVTADRLCGMANQKCTVIQKAKTWGGCKYKYNEDCLSPVFAEEMNDFCRGLGDCGGSVNINGEYSENYIVREDGSLNRGMYLSGSWISRLVALAVPVEGQFAEVEDYSEYLAAAGVWSGPVAPGMEAPEEGTGYDSVGMGVAGVGYAVGYAASAGWLGTGVAAGYGAVAEYGTLGAQIAYEGGVSGMSTGATMAGFSSAAMGAGIGMMVGGMLAKYLGLSKGGTMLMSVGGALIGAVLGYYMLTLTAIPIIGWVIIIIGLILMIIASFFGGSDCDPIEIEFECKAWKAPSGDADCDSCNGNPLKPCSEYRCSSLGAACVLINRGSEYEMCSSSGDDSLPPVIRPQYGVVGEGGSYSGVDDDGFSVSDVEGGCIDAYTPLVFGVVTSDLSHCKFDVMQKDFEEMSYNLGPNAYVYNHTTTFSLPDPSHGQSQGINMTGELSLFVKCRDAFGHESPGFYEIDMCVNEGEDVTAPMVVGVTPFDDAIVSSEVSEVGVELVTNELASCRWSLNDSSYGEMENDWVCLDSLGAPSNILGYSCTAILPLVGNGSEFGYYVRCADQPWLSDPEVESRELEDGRNANVESFSYNIRRPVEKITIDGVLPDGDFEVGTDMTTIDLIVSTSGGGDEHFCSYSFSGYDSMIEMFETGSNRAHSQKLNRPSGSNEIFVECSDETGDFVRGFTEFRIMQDSSSPVVARVWQNGGTLYVITTEAGECKYSVEDCGFAWEDGVSIGSGTDHSIGAIHGETYYIKCEDEFGNMPNGCSVAVQAS